MFGRHASRADTGQKLLLLRKVVSVGRVSFADVFPKILSYGAGFARHIHDACGYGWRIGDVHCEWPSLVAAKDQEIARLENVYRTVLHSSGVEVIKGRGVLLNPHTVEVSGRRLTAQKILLAVGGRPFVPSFQAASML